MIVNIVNLIKSIKSDMESDMKIDYLTPDEAILSELGQRLARVRKQQGLSQAKLAEEAGIGVATLGRIEAGQSGQMDSWLKIMKALRMTASVEAFLPENFDSPRAQVLSGKKYRRKGSATDKASGKIMESTAPAWGDEAG